MELKVLVESLLFVAEEPVSSGQFAEVLKVPQYEVERILDVLAEEYQKRGLRLQRNDGRVQLITAPEAAPVIQRFLGLSIHSDLSAAALETLAAVAYRQPITRAEIEAIRGVDCGGVLRSLVSRGLVADLGRLERAGRPIIYGTTFQFLRYFGLESLDDLPPFPVEEQVSKGAH